MLRKLCYLGTAALLCCFSASRAFPASFEELEQENQRLRAQLTALAAHPTSPDGEGESGEHGHADYEYLQPFDDRHDTIDGYPLMHLFKTEHAWLEREVHFLYSHSHGVDAGEAKESELEMELHWALNNQI